MKIKAHVKMSRYDVDHAEEIEIDDELIEGLEPEDKHQVIMDTVEDWANQHIEFWYTPVDVDGGDADNTGIDDQDYENEEE